MANWGKRLLGLAAVGGAAAGLVYYLKSKENIDMDDFDDDFEDDDFDLDNDLKPVTDREYVPLTPSAKPAGAATTDTEADASVDTGADTEADVSDAETETDGKEEDQ